MGCGDYKFIYFMKKYKKKLKYCIKISRLSFDEIVIRIITYKLNQNYRLFTNV